MYSCKGSTCTHPGIVKSYKCLHVYSCTRVHCTHAGIVKSYIFVHVQLYTILYNHSVIFQKSFYKKVQYNTITHVNENRSDVQEVF